MKGNSLLFANQGGGGGIDHSSGSLNGSKNFDAKLLSYEESKSKYNNYLLDESHPVGGSKAKFLRQTLGYGPGDGKALHDAISEAIDGKNPSSVEKTDYGTKYKFNTTIKGKDGSAHRANVTVVVQNDNGKTTWRLITVTPRKKGK